LFSVPIALFVDSFLAGNLLPIGYGFSVFFCVVLCCRALCGKSAWRSRI